MELLKLFRALSLYVTSIFKEKLPSPKLAKVPASVVPSKLEFPKSPDESSNFVLWAVEIALYNLDYLCYSSKTGLKICVLSIIDYFLDATALLSLLWSTYYYHSK